MAIILRWRYTPQVGAGDVTSLAAIVGPRGLGIASQSFNAETGVYTFTMTDGSTETVDFSAYTDSLEAIQATTEGFRDQAQDYATAAGAAAGFFDFADLATLQADTTLTYTAGQDGTVVAGDIVRTRKMGFAYEVAASGASDHHLTTAGGVKLYYRPSFVASPLALGAAVDGSTDDLAILTATADIAVAADAPMVLSGDYAISDTWALPPKLTLRGTGVGNTTIRTIGSFDAEVIEIRYHTEVSGFRVVIPNTSTFDAVTCHSFGAERENDLRGIFIHDLYLTGGSDSSAYALAIENNFAMSVKNIQIRTGMNGVRIENTDNVYNYGNSTFDRVEVSLTSAGRIGWRIRGQESPGTKFYNLMSFNYISAVTGSGTGSTGISIENCSYLTFINADIEGPETSLFVGQVSGGAGAASNTFINGYFSDDVNVASGSFGTVFTGGRIFGTFTDSGTDTRLTGVRDSSGDIIEGIIAKYVKAGPRFGPMAFTVELRNQTGATATQGTVVRIAGVDFGYQNASQTAGSWVGVVTEDTSAATNGDVAVSGVVQVRATSAVTRGDFLILGDGGNAGQVTTNGTTAPSGSEVLLGYAAQTTASAGLAYAVLAR